MDKIVVIADHSEGNQQLVKCLKLLFPECEIEVVSKRTEHIKDISLSPGAAYKDKKGKKSGKYSYNR